jgi:hypothetical protein
VTRQVVAFTTDKRFVRRARELTIIEAMVRLYCRGHAHAGRVPLCPDCAELFEYATRRLERCVFGDVKPTCANCTVHCYSTVKREQIRVVMKWAGPRMALRHPILSIVHLFDGRRPAPMLPATPAKRTK